MARNRDVTADALRFFEVPGPYATVAFVLAGLLTVLFFHGFNAAFDRWVAMELDQGMKIAAARGQSEDDARFEVLHKVAPEIFEWRQPLDALNHSAFLENEFASSLSESESESRFARPSLERMITSLARHACWAGNLESCQVTGESTEVLPNMPTHLQYLRFLAFLPGDKRNADLRRRLEGYEAHPRLSFLGLWKAAEPAPFEGRSFRVKRDEPLRERARLETLESVLNSLTARLAEEAWFPRRMILMLNGEIQWLTMFAAFWCLFLLGWRWWQAGRGRRQISALRDDAEPYGHGLPALWVAQGRSLMESGLAEPEARAELATRCERALEVRHYSVIDWLILIVPMLGFIGTIIGMTLAMGNAGQVVAAQSQTDLQRAMAGLTGYLGTAFDTTLVALVLSILLEGVRRSVARKELQLVDRLRSLRFRRDRDDAGLPEAVALAGRR